MSFALRIRGAAHRYRMRVRYERFRPQLSISEIYTALAPDVDVDLLSPDGFRRLWAAHIASTPQALWSVMPPATADKVASVRRDECSVLTRALTVTPETDWHCEPFHGIYWPKVHVESCPYSMPGGDLGVLWQLNRMQFLVDHAAAYRATGDESIAANTHALLDSWAQANPYLVGANWISPMETGLRLYSWSAALAGNAGSQAPDNARCERILRSVIRQVYFLSSHFSRWIIPNNHLIGEAATLAAFAAYWPILKDASAWMAEGENTLVDEARRQVLKDGFHFENSVNYHLVVLDYFLVYLHAKLLRGEAPHAVILEQTRAMADAALALVAPSGRMPMIGDDSFTRFMVLGGTMGSPGPVTGTVIFEDCVRLEHARLFAMTAWGRDLLTLRAPVTQARRFHEAGIDVARDAHSHIVFAHGPQHRRLFSHGHLHADAGSFELELDGTPLIVDSGTHLYDAQLGLRTHMRGPRAHNTVVVDGVEPMKAVGSFEWEAVATGEALGFGAQEDVVVAGCRKLPGSQHAGVDHTRALVRVGSTVIIIDALGSGTAALHTAALYFHTTVAPDVAVRDGNHVRLTDTVQFVRVFEVLDEPRARIDVIDDPSDPLARYSRAYGEVSAGATIRVSVPVEGLVVLIAVIRNPEVSVTRANTRVGDIGCAILEGHSRRIISVRLDPFAVQVGGRAITGSTATSAPRAPSTPTSLEWLDEIDS
jgi:Heparinase II/III N-terminus/Heparinase II/III-like protein